MTFPNIPADTVDDAILNLVGENASRAAVFTAQQQVTAVIDALQAANANSANCDVCGHFHALTEHPANAHSAETTPQPDGNSERCTKSHKGGDFDWCLAAHLDMLKASMRYGHRKLYPAVEYPDVLAGDAFAQYEPQPAPLSYDAIPKLERESGGDKTGTWTAQKGDLIGFTRHDHAMCDPDRNCGPDNAAPATSSFRLSTSPAAEAELAAMQRLHAATDLKEALRMTTAEAMRPAMDLIDGIRTSLPFPGGRMWSENTTDDHVHEVKLDTPWPEGGPEAPGDECCEPAAATPEDKLRIIADIVDGQAPLGTDLANFQRRLRIILAL